MAFGRERERGTCERRRFDRLGVGFEHALGDPGELLVGSEVVECEQRLDRDASTRRRRLVVEFLGARDERLAAARREVEGPLLGVPELRFDGARQVERECEVTHVAGRLVAGERAPREEGVILEVAVDLHLTVLVPTGEEVFRFVPEFLADEVERRHRGLRKAGVEREAGLGERRDHQPVPSSENFLVAVGSRALGARREHGLAGAFEVGLDVLGGGHVLVGERLDVGGQRQHRRSVLEVARLGDPVAFAEQLGGAVVAHRVVDLVGGPDVERTLLALARFADALGVEGAEEPSLGTREFAFDEAEGLAGDLGVALVVEQPVAVEVGPDEFGVVVEHLLEVGDRPLAVGSVTVEPAADVVAQSPSSHRVERLAGDGSELLVVGSVGGLHQEPEAAGLGELLTAARATVLPVRVSHGAPRSRFEEFASRRVARFRGVLEFARHRVGPLVGAPLDVLALGLPRLGDRIEEVEEPGLAAFRLRREVGPDVEGAAVGREPDRERPSASPAHHPDHRLVEPVEVGPLLPIDFYRDERLVEPFGNPLVLEALVGHDVTPVTRRVADREEDRDVVLAGRVERVVVPGLPVDGVVGVLAKVGTPFGIEPVSLGDGHGSAYAPETGKPPFAFSGPEFEREPVDVELLVVLEHPEDTLIPARFGVEGGDRRAVARIERALEEGERGRRVEVLEVDGERAAGTEVVAGGRELGGGVLEFTVAHVDGHVCHTGTSHRIGISGRVDAVDPLRRVRIGGRHGRAFDHDRAAGDERGGRAGEETDQVRDLARSPDLAVDVAPIGVADAHPLFDRLGDDVVRRDRVDPDVLARPFVRERAGVRDDARLRRTVGRHPRDPVLPRHARGVDHRAAAVGERVGERTGHVVGAGEVHPNESVPLVGVKRVEM